MKYKLSEIGRIVTGKTPSAKNKTSFSEEPDKYLFVTPRDMNGSEKTIKKTERYLTDEVTNTTFKNLVINDESICVSCIGTIGKVFMPSGPAITNQQINSITEIKNFVLPDYLYYYLTIHQKDIENLAGGTTMPIVNKTSFEQLKVEIPDLETQKKIVRILSALDQKIELNSQKNGTYFNICRSLLNNYLSAEDLEEHSLSEFLDVFTGKRNANETSQDGKYIFFSCAPEPLKADTYIFDGSAIIIAGNGAYTGRTRFYEGKMELYQRTYACTPKNNDIQPLIYGLYVYMKNKFEQEKMGGTHGSAIPYIVIGDITKYKILYNKERFEKFSTQVRPFIKAIQENENESIILANLRNSLLPKFIFGETNMEKALTNE